MRTVLVLSLLVLGCSNTARMFGGGNDDGFFVATDFGVPGPGDDLAAGRHTVVLISQNLKNKLDLLFMVDNSNSMEAMAQELRQRLPQFFQVLTQLAAGGTYADLHIGVVTSDYGAGSTGAPGCTASPGGQFGQLQAIGQAAPLSCKAPVGANYVQYQFAAVGDGPNNLPQGQDLIQTFTCMASVGARGCGFEHQLESVYAALHNNLRENAGFLRDDAMLTVVFLTNEDDSSAPPATDVFDKNKVAQYGFESSYRQTRWGVMCGNPPMLTPYGDSGGPLMNCQAATNPPGKEYDVHRYIDFFTRPLVAGGVKRNPLDVVLVGIDAPETPVQIILSNPGTAAGQAYLPCPQIDEASNPPCVPVLQHSCMNAQNSAFFGDPAVRLNTVINSAANHTVASICSGDYTNVLQNLGSLIVSQIGLGCLLDKLPDPNNPVCTAQDVTQNGDGTVTVTNLPPCAQGMFPCWKVEPKAGCAGRSPDGIGVTVMRNGVPAPDNTSTQVSCAL